MERCGLSNADAAEHVRQTEAELAVHRQQLQAADDGRLGAVLRDGSQPTAARLIAFEQLVHRYRPSVEFPTRPAFTASRLGGSPQ